MIFAKEKQRNPSKQAIFYRRKYRGLNDLLSYLIQLDENTIFHKDGALSRHFKYIAPDLESSSANDLDFHAKTWEDSFSFLGNGWMVETNVASEIFKDYANPQNFPDIVSALIDDERRLQYQGQCYFKTTHYLTITWKPEQLIESKLRYFAIEGDNKRESGFEEQLKQFDKTIQEFTGFLKRSLLALTPLAGHELVSYLHYCITGDSHHLATPKTGVFLDAYIAEAFQGGFEPKIAGKYIKVLAIDDLPSYSYPCILEALSYFPIEYRWSSRFICLDRLTAKAYLKRYERNWSSKAIGVMGVIRESMGFAPKRDEDAQATANQLKTAQIENAAGQVSYGFYNSNFILIHNDKQFLEKISQNIIARIQQLDFRVRDESVNAAEAYLGSLPCHGDYNLRKMLQDTHFIAHALPVSSLYQGEYKAPCKKDGYKDQAPLLFTVTKGNRSFSLNLHIGDVGHTAILGPTGSGKTTLNAILMASHRKYPDSRIIVLDKDHSNQLAILSLGGQYLDPESNLFQLGTLARVHPDHPEQIEKAIEWLSDCCRVQGVKITPARQKLLREAVNRLSFDTQSYKNLDHLFLQDPILREAIASFNSGLYRRLLNGTEPDFSGCDVLGFEMGSLVKVDTHARDLTIPLIKAIFNELEQLFKDKRPTLLILEEAWLYLRHPLFRNKLTDWFKTLRKLNVSVIFISQDLDDIVKSEAASVIQTSCMTRLYLPNKKAAEPHIGNQYRAFGLNEQQISIIKEATPKQDYYYQSELGNRLFTLDLGDVAQAFLCISEKSECDHFNTLYQPNNPKWVLDWLAYKGLNEWCSFAEKHYFSGETHA
jgi:type IV secretion/conjugal transfer VirB4 family ATPase